MRICSLEELSKKEVISCLDCTRLGFIVDMNICLEAAAVVSFEVELQQSSFCLKRKTITIPWECIKKIGDDLIIADYILPVTPEKQEKDKGFLSRLLRN